MKPFKIQQGTTMFQPQKNMCDDMNLKQQVAEAIFGKQKQTYACACTYKPS